MRLLLQLPDQSDTQYPDTLSPTWFLNRLSRCKRERDIFVRERESSCPANPASFSSLPIHRSLSLARLTSAGFRSLLAYHLNNANDWMVWVSKSRDNLYCNYNEALYIRGRHPRRSEVIRPLRSSLGFAHHVLPFLPFCSNARFHLAFLTLSLHDSAR